MAESTHVGQLVHMEPKREHSESPHKVSHLSLSLKYAM